MILVKLGGSVITDKSKLRTFKRSSCDRLAKEMSLVRTPLAIVHGAGSFGHIEAKKHGLHKGFKVKSQLHHVAAVQRDVRELNLRVLASLIDNGIRAVSVPPVSSAKFRGGVVSKFNPDTFGQMFDLGLTPVSFGDVVPDESMGFSICSGDLMMEAIAKAFRPKSVVFCADVDGVFDRDPKRSRKAALIPELDSQKLACIKRTESANADVTGSIYGKVERMLAIAQYCEKCMIVNGNVPGRLGKAVSGKEVVSTVVVPG
jgi:isopentenyl phosphate kinase